MNGCKILFFVSFVLLISCRVKDPQSETAPDLNDEADSISYYLGVYTGLTLREAGYTKFHHDLFDSAFLKTFYAKNVNEEIYNQADTIIATYIREGRFKKTLQEGEKFLAQNKTRKEVRITPSGLQYEIIKEGVGSPAEIGDSIKLFFTGTTLDGKFFMKYDSIPARMLLKNGTPGGIEAIQLMRPGAKYKFYVPTNLGYGKNPLPGSIIKPNMALIYTIELITITKNQKQ